MNDYNVAYRYPITALLWSGIGRYSTRKPLLKTCEIHPVTETLKPFSNQYEKQSHYSFQNEIK